MNWRHFQAFLWLHSRVLANQWRRGGTLNAVLMMIVIASALITAIPLFLGCFLLGQYLIPKATPAQILYAWDGVIVGFLFFWVLGLIIELQRGEPLSLSKFLHLPVSVNGAFLINYLSSLVRLSLVIFVPVMLGFALALVVSKGITLLPVLLLVAAFLLMVTALTYQFQGWLASLMSNPRRRRTVVVSMTAVFVLIAQLPNLVNLLGPWGPRKYAERSAALGADLRQLEGRFRAQEFDGSEYLRRQQELMKRHKEAGERADREAAAHWQQIARIANLVLPIGWLPLGTMYAAEGHVWPSMLALLGMTAIGTTALWRAYRTTIRMYQGQATNRKPQKAPVNGAIAGAREPGTHLLEARLPGVSEPVAAVALAGLRALLRAPEAKMMLLTPLIMVPIFGSMLFSMRHQVPLSARPLVAIGAMGVVLFGVLQVIGNQFGFDRDGFRVFVLSAASRRDILLGKNLAFAPMVLGMALVLLPVLQALCPMRVDHVLAMLPQYLSMFLMFCILANILSIYAPIYIAAGSLKPSNPKLSTVFLQLLMFLVLFPLTQGVTLLPLGAEALLGLVGWMGGIPVYLLLSLIECAAVVVIYHFTLDWLGEQLQVREQVILEAVTNRAT